MKLNYDRKSKDPTYFIQLGVHNAKKTTTKNVARIGKHSELLKITDAPLAYAKEQVKKYNEEYKKENRVSLDLKVNFAEKIKAADAAAAKKFQSKTSIQHFERYKKRQKPNKINGLVPLCISLSVKDGIMQVFF